MQSFCKDSHDFGLYDMKIRRKRIISIAITILVMASALHAVPVRNGNAVYIQPDGSSFKVIVKGDEWTRIRTTDEGCAIIMNEDGWWCYGIYEDDGSIRTTDYRVGKPVPSDIVTASRAIPYGALSHKAEAVRAKMKGKSASARNFMQRVNSPATRSTSSKIERRGIVIPVQFKDIKFTFTADDLRNMLNQKDYKGTGSAKDYYESQFGENWEFSFDVAEIVTLPNNLKYYGENDTYGQDRRPMTMALQACTEADRQIDFSRYDMDGDGIVDNVYIFYAGYDESENTDQTDLIWAHQYTMFPDDYVLPDAALTDDGVYLDSYACSAELTGRSRFGAKMMTEMGTFCHEYAHTLGLPDFYDTDYDDGTAWGAGLWRKTSLMDGGNYNNDSKTPPNLNCIERKLLGLSVPQIITAGKSYTLEPIHLAGQCYQMDSNTDGEYYLFECRSNEGWDKYIGGSGMLVYHIDETPVEYVAEYGEHISWWDMNIINADPEHQCADLIEADGRSDVITREILGRDIRGIFFPQSNVTAITPEGTRGYRFWTDGSPEISIIGITYKDGVIRFNTARGADTPEAADVHNFAFQAYPDAIFISFDSSNPDAGGSAFLEWKKEDDAQYTTVELTDSGNGSYSYLLKGLESGNTLYDLRIRFKNSGALGKEYRSQIMTKKTPTVDWPYLYLTDGSDIDAESGMVAHVVNARNAAEIRWYLDGEEIMVGKDYRIHPDRSGCLSCVITWKDGESDTIVKNIILTGQE